MATVPEANRILWEALDAIYTAQREAAQQARQAVAKLAVAHPEIVRDSLARDALRAADERQDGMMRFAQSQLALAETMRSYWAQRTGLDDGEPEPVPLVRRSNPFLPAATPPRAKAPVTVSD